MWDRAGREYLLPEGRLPGRGWLLAAALEAEVVHPRLLDVVSTAIAAAASVVTHLVAIVLRIEHVQRILSIVFCGDEDGSNE